MSLRPQPIDSVPNDTARVARASFPRGNTYMTLRDEPGSIFRDVEFAAVVDDFYRPASPLPADNHIAVVRPSTASASRIDMSRKAHGMRLPCPFAQRAGEASLQTPPSVGFFRSISPPQPLGVRSVDRRSPGWEGRALTAKRRPLATRYSMGGQREGLR
jgi:hypothetical protein